MDGWKNVGDLLASAATPLLFVGLAFANDTVLSKSVSEQITNAIKSVTTAPQTSEWTADIERLLAEYFPPKGNPLRFWTYVIAFSLAAMLCVLAVYCTRTRDLVPQLLTPNFVRQFLFDGLVKVTLVTAFAYRYYRHLVGSLAAGSAGTNLLWIVADAFAKAILFIGLTCALYAGFAATGTAFGGDVLTAIKSVPVTIREAVLFHNLTGVYIYALPLSSFPIYLVLIIRMFILYPSFARAVQRVIFFFPIAEKPVRAAALVFFAIAALFAAVMTVLVATPAQIVTR